MLEGAQRLNRVRGLHITLAFSDVVNGASNKARIEASRGQNQPVRAPRNVSVLLEGIMPSVLPTSMIPPMLFVHPAFGSGPTFYMCNPDSQTQ